MRWRSVMAGKTAQSRSPRDAGEGRAQRCVPSAREFWRRRRVREECRRAPLAGGGRGKFSGVGTDVPATAIGIQPCNRERGPTGRGEQSSPCRHHYAPGQIRRQGSALSMPIHQGPRPARKGRAGFVDDRNSRPPKGSNTSGEPAARPTRMAGQKRGRPEQNSNPAREIPASPSRNADRPASLASASPSRPPRRHADRLVRSCALTCDIRIGPSENSPALAFSVRPRR